jgi:NAD(P)H-quinone oxidoreductase subunit 5
MNEIFSQTIWLVPLYALIGAILAIPWSPGIIRETGPRPSGYLNALMTCVALVHSLVALLEVWHQPVQYLSFQWLHAADLNISFDIEVSSITIWCFSFNYWFKFSCPNLRHWLYGNGLGLGAVLFFNSFV